MLIERCCARLLILRETEARGVKRLAQSHTAGYCDSYDVRSSDCPGLLPSL